jgi:hypothetical protein
MIKKRINILEQNTLAINLIEKNDIKKKYGFVAMIDALGTKNKSYEEIQNFLENHLFVQNLFEAHLKDKLQQITIINGLNNQIFKPVFFIFQDTVIITLEVGDERNLLNYLNYFGTLVQYYISSSFINHILFRGAISFGEYFEYSTNFFFGEAINDAATYYEKPNLIGVMTTPKFSNFLDYLSQAIIENKIDSKIFNFNIFKDLFVSTDIPFKNDLIKGWLCNWPLALARQGTRPEDNIDPKTNALGVYYSLIKKYPVPKGTEEKYIHTTNYVEQLFKYCPDYLTYLRPEIENYPELQQIENKND